MKRLLLYAAMVLVVGVTGTAIPSDADADRCIQILRQGNIETLVNKCDQCKIAMLIRSRPGGAKPVTRQFTVMAKSTFPIPFKGSGRSRIKFERLCPRARGQAENENRSAPVSPDNKQCIRFETSRSGSVELVNLCDECRAAAIQRSLDGHAGGVRDFVKISAGGRTPISSQGYSNVGLLAEIPCPNG